MNIALIGFGEVGMILADDLGNHALSVFDTAFAEPGSPPHAAAAARRLHIAESAAEATRGAELVISAVTAAQDVAAAKAAAPGLARDALFLDLNSASPAQKQASAAVIAAAGGRYVEAAVMTPFPPKRLASAMLLGGPHAAAFTALGPMLGFTGASVFSPQIGQASATKMCRSVMIKGIEALCLESLLTARRYSVEDAVLASLSDLLPVGDWPGLARYMISRTLEHGARRSEEMREAAHTVREAGLSPLMSDAIAERQAWAAQQDPTAADLNLGAMLDTILREPT